MATQSFVDRIWKDKNGKPAIVQFPNVPLWVWFAASVVRRLLAQGTGQDMFGALATVALITWALLELFKGDSYIRRVLGAIVLSGIIVSYLR